MEESRKFKGFSETMSQLCRDLRESKQYGDQQLSFNPCFIYNKNALCDEEPYHHELKNEERFVLHVCWICAKLKNIGIRHKAINCPELKVLDVHDSIDDNNRAATSPYPILGLSNDNGRVCW